MRRVILGSFLAATMALPAAALAKPTTGLNTNQPTTNQGAPQNLGADRAKRPHDFPANGPNGDVGSLGGGAVGGNEPGHVDSPGNTKIDNDSRGPINDVQPGRGTNDTRQSANPKPMY